MERVTGQLLDQNSHKMDCDHKIWNIHDECYNFGSYEHIFEDTETKNNTPTSLGNQFNQNV